MKGLVLVVVVASNIAVKMINMKTCFWTSIVLYYPPSLDMETVKVWLLQSNEK